MIDIIKGLLRILESYNIYADYIPLGEVDFINGEVGVYYEIEGATDETYRQDYDLRICVTGNKDFNLKLIETFEEIDKLVNGKEPTPGSRIKHKNAFLNTLREEEEITYILEYYIKNLRG